MTYSLYSVNNLTALYIKQKTPNSLLVCFKGFLKPFLANTIIYKDSYLEYY